MPLLDKIIKVSLALTLGIMSLIVAGNVFFRFIINSSLYWADEVAQALLVWLTFLGAALAVKEKSHYVLNYLTDKLKGNVKRYFWIIQQFLILSSIIVLLYFSSIVAWKIRFWVLPATEISRTFVYIACPIGCLFMLCYALKIIMQDYKKIMFDDQEQKTERDNNN